MQLVYSAAGGIGSAPRALTFFLTGRTGGPRWPLTDAEGDGAESRPVGTGSSRAVSAEGASEFKSPMVPAKGRVKS